MITVIKAPFDKAHSGFNRDLFEFLLPPFKMAEVNKYEGQNPGDIIDLRFRIPFIGSWSVIIKEKWLSHREYGFIDRGLRVPFGISYWQHIHRVVARTPDSSFIIDDIEYETQWKLLDYLLYIPLFLAFFPRKSQYKKYYKALMSSDVKQASVKSSGFLNTRKRRNYSGEWA